MKSALRNVLLETKWNKTINKIKTKKAQKNKDVSKIY